MLTRRALRFSTIAAVAGFLAVGCRKDAENGKTVGASNVATFKVALLTPGPVSDQSWNGGAYQGLLWIRDSLGAQVSHVETKTPAEFEDNFRQYGTQGYDLVFGHGFEFQDAARRVAPEFPRTLYITTSGSTSGANLAGMTFGFADASYLAGVLAASVTKTKRIGTLGGTALPPVVESFRAFEQGARATDPSIRVIGSYVGNWDDVSAGKEQALAQLAQGVDVIFQNADAAGLGAFQAARERSALVIGSNANQNGVAPDVTLGSVVIDLPRAFLQIAREVKAKTFQPRVVELGEESHVVTLVLNPALTGRIPTIARARIDSLQALMLTGRYKIHVDTTISKK
ncbi:MAG TPA: BMP family protein [Gemmatimonadaceae bacterium]|jgi:basic membrane lipoprotein Med (substrate-binding protein (PBP1-ABC) superfamily)|nr:BMP family protein [Gemmatimonadaceae bacterium]